MEKGLKFLGNGEWLARKHRTQRRQYRKVNRRGNSLLDCFLILLILAMDTVTGAILAIEFTSSDKGDSPVLPPSSGADPT